jgi:hypothetical protein
MAIYSGSIVPGGYLQGCQVDLKAQQASGTRLLEVSFDSPSINYTAGFGRAQSELSQLGPITLRPENPNDPSTFTSMATSWVTPPAAPLQYLRRLFMNTANGGGIFTFPAGLTIAGSASVMLYCITTGASFSGGTSYWVCDE